MDSANFNFIKNRSFEIAWAVFRCSALFSQNNLKSKVEDVAVDLVAFSHSFQKDEFEAAKQFSVLSQLEVIIKLAEALKEINTINAQVLFREINNLTWAIQSALSEIKQAAEIKPAHPDIEAIFSPSRKKNERQSENDEEKIKEDFGDDDDIITEISENDDIDDGFSGDNRKIKKSKPIKKIVSSSAIATAGLDIKSLINKRKSALMESSSIIRNSDSSPLDSADSWQNTIFNKFKEMEKLSTRELIAFFPQISERTVRFYLQKLTDAGLIKRVGNPGPSSYYMMNLDTLVATTPKRAL